MSDDVITQLLAPSADQVEEEREALLAMDEEFRAFASKFRNFE